MSYLRLLMAGILSHSQKILTFGPSKEKSLPINPTSTASATLPATLKNLGQTCYVNAVIQSLYYSPYRAAVLGERRGIFASSSSAVAATTVDTISAHNCAAAAGDDDGRAGAGDITSSGCGGEKTAISCNDESTSENDHGVDASKGLCDIGTASRLRSRSRKFAHFSTGAVLEALFRYDTTAYIHSFMTFYIYVYVFVSIYIFVSAEWMTQSWFLVKAVAVIAMSIQCWIPLRLLLQWVWR